MQYVERLVFQHLPALMVSIAFDTCTALQNKIIPSLFLARVQSLGARRRYCTSHTFHRSTDTFQLGQELKSVAYSGKELTVAECCMNPQVEHDLAVAGSALKKVLCQALVWTCWESMRICGLFCLPRYLFGFVVGVFSQSDRSASCDDSRSSFQSLGDAVTNQCHFCFDSLGLEL